MAAASPSETPGSSQIAPSPWERRKLGLPTPAPALPAPGLSQALSQVQNRCTSATPATTTQTSTQGGTRPPDGDNLSDSDLSDDDNILHPLNCSQKRKRLDNDDDDDECHDIDDRLHRVREVARKCGLNEKMFDQLTHFSDQSPRTQRYYLFAGMLCQNALTTNFASNVHASWEVSSTLKVSLRLHCIGLGRCFCTHNYHLF
ncbi:hypothetical protein BOTBODRAFT_225709 [Botryobasidium botryosum FD-172 SS1]|uniref:Uncharacterized protein n=1 Tax=Botryobasidium botryosum (strain FD-172 SS1) TaxID=930990 RepID=A0A067MQZ9_BOTB1|nr:hypothetical protein BOTBODRAFT_225709 [Botryobasidium botryosum FD-172 SS1]